MGWLAAGRFPQLVRLEFGITQQSGLNPRRCGRPSDGARDHVDTSAAVQPRLTHPPDSQRIYGTADTADTFDPRRFAFLEQIARGDALPELLAAVVRFIEERAPAMLGSIVLIEDGCIRAAMGDRLPAAYRDALVGLPTGPSAGSCGTAAFRGQRVVVEDIDTDDLWADYRDLVRPYGLRACWSNPIHLPESGVVGTFAMYYSERRAPPGRGVRVVRQGTRRA